DTHAHNSVDDRTYASAPQVDLFRIGFRGSASVRIRSSFRSPLWSCAKRLARLSFVLLRHAFSYAMGARLRRWKRLANYLPPGTLSKPQRLRAVIEEVGGTFLKFGQMLALQPDILSFEYCRELTNLLDRIAPFSYEEVARIFVEELGRAPKAVFDSFDE